MLRRDFIGNQIGLLATGLTLGVPFAQRLLAQSRATKTIRVGMVELDTTHSDTFARVLKNIPGMELSAVINRGAVYGAERTEQFVKDFSVPHVCETVEEMLEYVDCGLVVGVNWENHVSDAEPFIVAGKPVFIDKPVIGRECDARYLMSLASKYQTPIYGGSTVRYSANLPEYKQKVEKRKDRVSFTVYGVVNSHSHYDMLDLMYYGIHGAELMEEVMGPGALSVNYIDFYRKEHIIHVKYDDRPPVILMLGWISERHRITMLTDKGPEDWVPDSTGDHEGMFNALAKGIETGRPDRPINEQIEACRILIAADKSRKLGRRVYLSELDESDGFSGKIFAKEYSEFRHLPRAEQVIWREHER